MIPTSIDGTDITGATIDGTDVTEITVDGQTVFTAETIIDNFEDASNGGLYGPGDTVADYYQGSTSSWGRTTSDVGEGNQSLEKVGSSFGSMYSLPGDGLNNYISEGDTVQYLVRDAGDDKIPTFCANVENATNPGCYGFSFRPDTNSIVIRKITNLNNQFGTETNLSTNSSISINLNEWYVAEVELPTSGNDTITYSIFELTGGAKGSFVGDVTANDNAFASGPGIGFYHRSGGGDTALFDNIKIL